MKRAIPNPGLAHSSLTCGAEGTVRLSMPIAEHPLPILAACNLANFNSLVKVSFMGTPGASFPEIVQLFHFKTAHSSLKRSRRFTHALNPH